MPHYTDGTPAAFGDKVKGKPYNTDHEVVGEVVEVREGESCNLTVAFIEIVEIDPRLEGQPSAGSLKTVTGVGRRKFALLPKYDYGDTKAFAKI